MDSRHPGRARSGVTLHLVPNTGRESASGDEPSRCAVVQALPAVAGTVAQRPDRHAVSLGCAAILAAYRSVPLVAWPVGLAYLVFAMVQLYMLMPLVVCPGCVYRTLSDGRCPSGLNLISAKLCPPSAGAFEFGERAHGALCQSSLCLWSWIAPVALALPALALWFSWTAATLVAIVAVLAVLRLTFVARVAVCPHCLARRWCPAARTQRAA